ncbi:interferon gamma-like isoform X2 [Nerophis ophidion]|uniref:interferon gamma-like isoform X2 n=1 Tax=Nerophis ophidion TaxID=159077 RepID=UPI002AE048E1|nr:interferon gamma-like isoform X2 [Nerophis ophidion]
MVTAAMARTTLCVCVCLLASQVATSHVSEKMNRTIQNLLQHYIPARERFNRRPVFSRELLGTKLEAKELLLSAALQTYEELVQHMLKELPGEESVDVRADLSYILERVQHLRRFRFQEQDKLLDGLHTFRHVMVDNELIQSKALWELPWLYEEASSLANKRRQRRRRKAKWPRTFQAH